MNVLFVCSGNVCRSPLAEAMLRRLAAQRRVGGVTVSSAGTAAWDGAPASEGSYLVALEHGLDLSAHQARQITAGIVAEADLILCMGEQHVEQAEALGGSGKTHLLGSYAGEPPGNDEVADPFGGDVEEYRATYLRLSALVDAALSRLVSERPRADRE